MLALILGTASAILWLIIACLPWRPWSTRETLEADPNLDVDLGDVTVLIPARNESAVIKETIHSVIEQSPTVSIIVIDDQSDDDTANIVHSIPYNNLTLVEGLSTPKAWSGKLYALEQGRQQVNTDYILLLDADIRLTAGTLAKLKQKMQDENLSMLSLMANLQMATAWEKLLMPAFIYFFKLLYPFQLSNQSKSSVAAAAGGCILIKTSALNDVGGFSIIKSALIDDCSLAKAIKNHGNKIWTGLTHSVISQRSYVDLSSIWLMVTRTAFTQLHHSFLLLILCLCLMILAYVIPVAGIVFFTGTAQLLALLAFGLMLILYMPTLMYYGINGFWALTIPFAASLYIVMTCDSARKHLFGSGAEWKGRHYA